MGRGGWGRSTWREGPDTKPPHLSPHPQDVAGPYSGVIKFHFKVRLKSTKGGGCWSSQPPTASPVPTTTPDVTLKTTRLHVGPGRRRVIVPKQNL